MSRKSSISRRKFLVDSTLTAAAFSVVPRHVLGHGLGFGLPPTTASVDDSSPVALE